MKFRRILEVFSVQALYKSYGRIFLIFASKNEAVCCWVQTHFKNCGFSWFMKKVWVHFHNFCIQKWSCLLLSSVAFWKLWLCLVYEESFGCIFMIYASKNEAVCCWVQTHFESSLPARFTEKVLGAFLQFMHPNMKLFPAKLRRILEVFTLQGIWQKFWVHYHDFSVNEQSCLPWSSDGFWTLSPCKLYKKVTGAFSRFLRSKMKLFAMKFRQILQFFSVQAL